MGPAHAISTIVSHVTIKGVGGYDLNWISVLIVRWGVDQAQLVPVTNMIQSTVMHQMLVTLTENIICNISWSITMVPGEVTRPSVWCGRVEPARGCGGWWTGGPWPLSGRGRGWARWLWSYSVVIGSNWQFVIGNCTGNWLLAIGKVQTYNWYLKKNQFQQKLNK